MARLIDFNDRPTRSSPLLDGGNGVPARTDSDNRSAYLYEGRGLPWLDPDMYGTDGVEDPSSGEGFQVFSALGTSTTARCRT